MTIIERPDSMSTSDSSHVQRTFSTPGQLVVASAPDQTQACDASVKIHCAYIRSILPEALAYPTHDLNPSVQPHSAPTTDSGPALKQLDELPAAGEDSTKAGVVQEYLP